MRWSRMRWSTMTARRETKTESQTQDQLGKSRQGGTFEALESNAAADVSCQMADRSSKLRDSDRIGLSAAEGP